LTSDDGFMAHAKTTYELLDFGNGRKLERFAEVILDRPSPAAEGQPKAQGQLWKSCSARYERTQAERGVWTPPGVLQSSWEVAFSMPAPTPQRPDFTLAFQLQPSPFGHVGVFPEQRANWEWIARQTAKSQAAGGRRLRVLNLFAYTGGSTLAAAVAGAEVVQRARKNAETSGLSDRPIRWIAEDAQKFCQRELKRGNHYEAVILDPPTYGHGPKGEPWKIGEHLLPLLKLCGELTADRRAFVLVTCHSPGIGEAELAAYLAEGIFGHCGQGCAAGGLFLQTADGRRLPSGIYARWPDDSI
jgi:23S rRNA (cytosine1962-C5)-methyltransferase